MALAMLAGVQTELQVPLVFVGEDHSLVVIGIERFARPIQNLPDIVHGLRAGTRDQGDQQPIDTNTAAGKHFSTSLVFFAELETNVQRERQLQDIEEAKARTIITAVSHVSIPTQCQS